METFLKEVADTSEEVAAEQREVARQARTRQRVRDRIASCAELLDRQSGTTVLGRLRDSGRKLADATGRLSQSLAVGLRREGLSHRAIARNRGVTHQRVSALLNHRAGSADPRA